MGVSLRELISAFPGWEISDAAGGGWYAVRIATVPAHGGLSNVRCGATLEELRKHLEWEAQRASRPARLRGAA